MKTIKLCDDRRLDAILKTIIAFTSLTLMALCVLYLKDERMVLRGFRKPGTRLQPDREGTADEPGR